MNAKTHKNDLYKSTAIEIYKMILKGDLKKFPAGFWQRPEANKNAMEVTKYLLEEILKWSSSDIKNKISANVFVEYRLNGMIQQVYKQSPFEAINAIYPNRYKPWELGKVPTKYWTLDIGIKATKWLIEEKLKWQENDIKEKISHKVFFENGLGGMLRQLFNSSPYDAINATYPNKFKPWELGTVPRSYWTVQTGREATQWFIEEKLKWTDEEVKMYMSLDIFMVNGLRGMLERVYNASFFNAIDSAYPNKFNYWEFSKCPRNYWTLETGIKATKWLIEEKLKWSKEDINNKISLNVFNKHGLNGMLQMCFDNSASKALNAAYPDIFKSDK